MKLIFKRPPGDNFSFRLWFSLTSQIQTPHDAIYIWATTLGPEYTYSSIQDGKTIIENSADFRKMLIDAIHEPTILIGIKDHLTPGDFNPWQCSIPIIAQNLKNLIEYFHSKNFVLFTSLENLESYIQLPNLSIIPWGGDITNHQKEYAQLIPVIDKNFNSQTTFLSLNRHQRTHRAMLLALLYKLNLQNFGLISCMFKDQVLDLFEYTQWKTKKQQMFEEGFTQFKDQQLSIADEYEIYIGGNNDNAYNFKNKLTTYYQTTFVEIITETSYTESCFNLTEKTLNSIYGCCFPILLCSTGTVAFLRDIGMDMFDDIVDHSYDQIADPTERMYRAITDNIELLTNIQQTKNLWKGNEQRFIKNVNFARTRLFEFYSNRAKSIFDKVTNDE